MVETRLRSIAGVLILMISLITYYVNSSAIWFLLIIGLNLLQSGFTNWCPMVPILQRLGKLNRTMTDTEAEKAVRGIVGTIVVADVFLVYVLGANWIWVSIVLGAALLIFSFIGFCPMKFCVKKLYRMD